MYLLLASLILAAPTKPVLTPIETLGAGGREITFVDDHTWYTSSGYIVTRWEKNIPREQFNLNSYNYLLATKDQIFGDREIFDLKTKKKIEIRPALLNEKGGRRTKSYGLEVEHLNHHPTKDIALLNYNWRPPRGYAYAYPNKKNPLADRWYLIETKTGKTIIDVEKKGYSTPEFAFSEDQLAITGKNDGVIDLYNFKGKILKSFKNLNLRYINQVYLFQGYLIAADNEGSVAIIELKSDKITTIRATEKPIGALTFLPDKKWLIVGDMKGYLMVLGGKNFKEKLFEKKLSGEIQEMKLNPSKNKLYVGYQPCSQCGEIALFGVGQ